MSELDDLAVILNRCKCGVHIEINVHRNYYQTAAEALEAEEQVDIDPDVRQRMIDTNTIADVQAYPDTPIGSYRVLHFDVRMALGMIRQILERQS